MLLLKQVLKASWGPSDTLRIMNDAPICLVKDADTIIVRNVLSVNTVDDCIELRRVTHTGWRGRFSLSEDE